MSDDDRKSRVPHSILMATVIVLTAVSAMTALAQKAARVGPQVGDVVAFDPAHPSGMDTAARLIADRPRLSSCVLDVAMIQRSGGSLVVEQRGDGPERFYRAHWAGRGTSSGPGDCGVEADLLLSQFDINTLATAAGGFGVDHHLTAMPQGQ